MPMEYVCNVSVMQKYTKRRFVSFFFIATLYALSGFGIATKQLFKKKKNNNRNEKIPAHLRILLGANVCFPSDWFLFFTLIKNTKKIV